MPTTFTLATFTLDTLATPIGRMLVASDGEAVRALDWADYEPRMRRLLRLHYGAVDLVPGALPEGVRGALCAYFAGDLGAIEGIPVRTGGTVFQRSVWAGLRAVPVGHAWSYGDLAAFVGRPRAVRAVGAANGANPVGVIVPCHRVIGADRSLTGYGGGLERKRWLLRHEGAAFRDTENRDQVP